MPKFIPFLLSIILLCSLLASQLYAVEENIKQLHQVAKSGDAKAQKKAWFFVFNR